MKIERMVFKPIRKKPISLNNLISFEKINIDKLETLLNDLGQCHPQKLADAIMKEMTERNCVDDDATIIVARVEDITQIHID